MNATTSRSAGLLVLAVAASAGLPPAHAFEDPSVQRGRHFAETYCARCHAVGLFESSPLPEAPAFRTLGRRYPLDDLVEPLAEGIKTGHPSMPEWHLDPGDAADVVAYMKSIQGR